MHSISVDHSRAMVIGVFQGDVLLSERLEAIEEIASAAELIDATKVLVDFTAAKLKGTTVDMALRFGRALSSSGPLRHCRAAYVLPEACDFDPAVEIFARGHGFAPERFISVSEAVRWLTD